MYPLISSPHLPIWAQQLAGILPLAALVEFIDVSVKLHLFELAGSVSLWNWPVTPAGARVLLSEQDISDSCCLDRTDRSVVLHCIDGRYGDWYPSSTPTTTRLWVSGPKTETVIRNESPNMADPRARRQQLKVFHLSQRHISLRSRTPSSIIPSYLCPFRAFLCYLRTRSLKYRVASVVGWTAWIGLTVLSFMAGWYFAAGYLLLMPAMGLVVYMTHGGKPRRLLDERTSTHDRLVVATSSLNGSDWLAFFGGSFTLNSLLNKPLYRSRRTPAPTALRLLTRFLIVAQWVLAVASCAVQDWNAFVITVWILFCASISSYAYSAKDSARDWLKHHCSIVVNEISTEFSSRRAMLTTLMYLNPDSREDRTSWINPILADSYERRKWEVTVLGFIKEGGPCSGEWRGEEYWWPYVDEGLEMGRRIKSILDCLQEDRNKDYV